MNIRRGRFYQLATLVRPTIDYTQFLAIYESYTDVNNNSTIWNDLSGNGFHLIPDEPFQYMISPYVNLPAYSTNPTDGEDMDRNWNHLSTIYNTPSDYTIMFAFRPSEDTQSYLALLDDLTRADGGRRYTYLVSHKFEPSILYQSGQVNGNNYIPANQLTIMEFVLANGKVSVYVNGQLRFGNLSPYVQTKILGLYIYNQKNNYVLKGEHYGFAIALGDRPDLRLALRKKWKYDLNMTF